MTKWIRMRETLSGGRADGRPWPPAGEAIDVPDWEYDHAVAAGWAYHDDGPPEPEAVVVKVPVPVPVPVPVEAVATGEPDSPLPEIPLDEADRDTDVPEVPEPPRPSDPKQDWVDYAVTRGMSEEKATAMSKADLMSRYGGRL